MRRPITEAAAKAGIDESTVRRWLAEDETFQAEYAAARQAAFQAGIYRAQALTARAMDTLEELLDDEKHPNVRLPDMWTPPALPVGPTGKPRTPAAGGLVTTTPSKRRLRSAGAPPHGFLGF